MLTKPRGLIEARPSHLLFLILLLGCVAALLVALAPPSQAGAGHAKGKPTPLRPAPYPQSLYSDNPAFSMRYSPLAPEPDREGGPDAYGYVFADDRDPGGPAYSFQQVADRIDDDDWTLVRGGTGDPMDDGVVTTTLPFSFNFYGVTYNTVHIATNGNLHFGAPNDYWPQAVNDACPRLPANNQFVPKGIVAPLWFDFVVPTEDEGGVYTGVIGSSPNRAYVVEWRSVHQYDDENERATFEALLYENGDIVFQYQILNGTEVNGTEGVIGIQNPAGTIGLQYSCYSASVVPERAIRYRVRQAAIFTPAEAEKGGAPGATLIYTQTLTNQTGQDNSFTIAPSGNTWTTTVEPASTGTMTRGSSRNINVRVEIPSGTNIGARDVVTINVSSTLPNPGTYTATAVLTSSVSSLGVDFDPATEGGSGGYGSPVTYTVVLTNRSGVDNTFDLQATGNMWPTTVYPTQTGQLDPEESTQVSVTVHVPEDASLGARDVVTITATGQEPEPGQYFGFATISTTAGLWERKSSMPQPRSRGAAVTFMPNGKVYVLGGENNNGTPILAIEEYDPINNSWRQRADLQVGVSNVGAAVIGNAIYVPGGYNQANGAQTLLQVYYPLENRIEVISSDPMPAPRLGAGVAAYNNKLYVIGGSNGTSLAGTATVYEYDPARPAGSRWQSKAAMPTARVYLGAVTLDGIIYAAGGLPAVNNYSDLDTVEAYNPATNSWAARTPMSQGRAGLALVGVNSNEAGCGGYLYALAGGYADYTATAERYNPGTDSWEPISNLSIARRTLAAVYSPGTYSLLAFGGWTGTYETITEAIRCSGALVPPTPVPSPTPICGLTYTDVPPGSTFYPYVMCLACQGIVGGYQDGTFRPNSEVTRGQLAKIVSNAAAFNDPVTAQTFEDVPADGTFYTWIERLAGRGIMGGYHCGGANEPCGAGNKPYFRPNANATRGQIA
ncbi:MAG TPA: S-layer homology domain-containing protein, partial [Chloroflexia bacterium]|nr:S-layer homology domain-containing protein [Chloroflexia bacterium]